ncbi:MAG: DUF814 domain-containing protein [Nanoarchaeota archaeon]|nr:DUF814 domain-containing protein [Nanoarchaeota archaeon]MBU0977328.1 DUF814 domain-containing protein [Nanoarchaeota archaeon]
MEDYQKYRWFVTSSGKIVIGGKSSTQNDELLKQLKKEGTERMILHTSAPGSPFSIILAEFSDVTERDTEEATIFTGCFSRQWRDQAKKAEVDIFKLSEIYKLGSMKTGTWGVKGKINRMKVNLELVLTIQKDKLRAVPEITAKKKEVLLKIRPGKIDKREMLIKLHTLLPDKFTQEEILQALPPGGVSIVRR